MGMAICGRGGRVTIPNFRAWDEDSQKMNGNVEIYIMNSVKFQLERKVSKG